MSVYGRKRKTKILFSYTFQGGNGHKTMFFTNYRGMSVGGIGEVRKIIETELGNPIVINNWKVLNER